MMHRVKEFIKLWITECNWEILQNKELYDQIRDFLDIKISEIDLSLTTKLKKYLNVCT